MSLTDPPTMPRPSSPEGRAQLSPPAVGRATSPGPPCVIAGGDSTLSPVFVEALLLAEATEILATPWACGWLEATSVDDCCDRGEPYWFRWRAGEQWAARLILDAADPVACAYAFKSRVGDGPVDDGVRSVGRYLVHVLENAG